MVTLSGVLEHITYQNQENQYLIGRLRADGSMGLVTIVGYLAGVGLGEKLTLDGKWETHPKYGQQFKVNSFEVTLPTSLSDVEKYLKSGIIKGIGKKAADRMLRHFQENTLEIIEKFPERLIEVDGIGKKTIERISSAWKAHHEIRELMDFLQSLQVNVYYSSKIFKYFGKEAVSIIKASPYRLARDIPEIDFHTADLIAKNLGYDQLDPERISACIEYQLGKYVSEGHTFMKKSLLLKHLSRRFQIGPDVAELALRNLDEEGFVVLEETDDDENEINICPGYLFEAETGIAERVKMFLTVPLQPADMDRERIVKELMKKMAIRPSSEQLDILEGVMSHRVAVITGGPGTGKTTLIRSITVILDALGKKVMLAAPTGRAARRLSDVTRRKAETIHKLLRYNLATQEFDKNRDDPIDADAIIIDEASMIDTVLMYHLLSAVPFSSMIILVGDIFQLPSIGPGNVLSDMIKSDRIESFELTKIFRQAHESPIVETAHKIRKGILPELKPFADTKAESDFFFIEQDSPDAVVDTIVEWCNTRMPKQPDLKHINEIQVITPMHKGTVGTLNLNQVLQKALNPAKQKRGMGKGRFKLNDKVMHLKNNYQKEVFNGDIGIVHDIDSVNQKVFVNYDERIVDYDFEELDELALAYAISVHKSQGSEYPTVIIPLLTQHFALLQRNLLYTAVTRGKNLVVIIGTTKAFSIALNNDKPRQRLSNLQGRLNM